MSNVELIPLQPPQQCIARVKYFRLKDPDFRERGADLEEYKEESHSHPF